nr:hypothetical protein [Tanacetum cinerariifolium]
MFLYVEGKEHGEMLIDSILKGLFEYKVVDFLANEAMGIPTQTRIQTFTDLSPEEKIKKECDIRAANIILPGLPNDIYTLLNHKMSAYEIWYKEKMLLAQQQEARIKIVDEQQDFLADGIEGFDSYCEELRLNATSIIMTKKVDAYNSKDNDVPTASTVFLAKLSPAGSINGDEVGPSYNSDILSEVPNYDTYHLNDMLNLFVQEFLAFEQLVSVNDTYLDFLSISNVISDNPYPDNSKNEVVQEMTSLA